jgi:3-phenylpropionate/trans-cinnamate dioxygenase ferredoxin subunit
MPNFSKVAKTREVPPGHIRGFNVNGQDVAIANVDGTFHAFSNVCPHQGVPFTGGVGAVFGGQVICLMHDSVFSLETGAWTDGPASEPLPVYACRVEGDEIFVSID